MKKPSAISQCTLKLGAQLRSCPPQTDPGPPAEGTSRSQATAPNDSPPSKKPCPHVVLAAGRCTSFVK